MDVLEDTGPPIHPCAMPWYVAVLANLGPNVFITTFDVVNLFVWGPVLLWGEQRTTHADMLS